MPLPNPVTDSDRRVTGGPDSSAPITEEDNLEPRAHTDRNPPFEETRLFSICFLLLFGSYNYFAIIKKLLLVSDNTYRLCRLSHSKRFIKLLCL